MAVRTGARQQRLLHHCTCQLPLLSTAPTLVPHKVLCCHFASAPRHLQRHTHLPTCLCSAATVRASTPAKVLCCTRADFDHHLGSLAEIRNMWRFEALRKVGSLLALSNAALASLWALSQVLLGCPAVAKHVPIYHSSHPQANHLAFPHRPSDIPLARRCRCWRR